VKLKLKLEEETFFCMGKLNSNSGPLQSDSNVLSGLVTRLTHDSPAPIALNRTICKIKKPKGSQIALWISVVQKSLKELNISD